MMVGAIPSNMIAAMAAQAMGCTLPCRFSNKKTMAAIANAARAQGVDIRVANWKTCDIVSCY
jgi:hypothetical protein